MNSEVGIENLEKPAMPVNRIICGDCREVMRQWPDSSVDCCVTSPPYWGLRDYKIPPVIWRGPKLKSDWCEHVWGDKIVADNSGGGWNNSETRGNYDVMRLKNPEKERAKSVIQGQFCQKCGAWLGCLGLEPTLDLYVRHITEVFREVRRILKPWGTLWLNIGDSYYGSGQGFGDTKTTNKNHKGSRERIKPQWLDCGLKPKDLCMIPARVALALQADGWWLRSEIIWHKPNPMPESCKDRCTKSHEQVYLLTKSPDYFYDYAAIMEESTGNSHERGGGVNPKAENWKSGIGWGQQRAEAPSQKKEDQRHIRIKQNPSFSSAVSGIVMMRNRRTVWKIPTQPTSDAHFATFPEKLVEPCILAGTSEKGNCPKCGKPRKRIIKENRFATREGRTQKTDDLNYDTERHCTQTETIGWTNCGCGAGFEPAIVFDPFIGSGTTGKVALKNGRNFVGIDISDRYVKDIANWHIREAMTGVPVKEQRKGQKALFV